MYVGRIISIANQKGGVGKTTTAINLAASVSLAGRDILIIDTDPQCNSTSGIGIERGIVQKSIYDVYMERCGMDEVVLDTSYDNLYIVPASLDLLAVEIELIQKERREYVLSEAIRTVKNDFQFIFIDCPPSLGLLTLNALVAADSVIVPVQCEYYALEGLSMLTRTIKQVRSAFNPALEIEGIVLTMHDVRNNLSAQVAEEVRSYFGDKVFATKIPRNVRLSEAPSHGKPILDYDVSSKGAQSYLSLAKELLHEKSLGARA